MSSEHHITILFDKPFWIALFERHENNEYAVAKAIISTHEPEAVEVAEFLGHLDLDKLEYTTPVKEKISIKKIGFKKQQKIAQKATKTGSINHVYTKAQSLLKEQSEVNKKEKKTISKTQREQMEQRKFELKKQKKKEKHRGH